MIVSTDPIVMTEWAVGFLTLFRERPRPRTGLHYGRAVYRDGDYYGNDVNLTHRIVARALAGEVLVTQAVVDAIGSSEYLAFEPIGKVDLKGFPEPAELFVARADARRLRNRDPSGPRGSRLIAAYDRPPVVR